MPKTFMRSLDAEEVAEMADRGQDISAHFTNQFIRTKQDHRAAVTRIEELMSAIPGTPEGNELNKLATAVDAYEREQTEPECSGSMGQLSSDRRSYLSGRG